MDKDTKRKVNVWVNKGSAIAWAIAGVLSFILGWAYSVAFVTIASIYANVKTDWGTAEAADDRTVLDAIDQLRKAVLERQHCPCCPQWGSVHPIGGHHPADTQ
jgi:hypothetical protein